jgi:Kef-type K+ transport system membrane component KefB/predicted transcriptional regulator
MAFVLIVVGTGLLVGVIFHSVVLGVVAGIVLGAIGAASDPPCTVTVLWEYRTAGPLSSTLTAIVALDDALALILYALGTSVATMLTKSGPGSTLASIGGALLDLVMAGVLGAVFAGVLMLVVFRVRESHVAVAAALGVALVLVVAAQSVGADVILAAMFCGFVVRNLSGDKCESMFSTLRQVALPIMVIFFVLVGARLQITAVPLWLIGLLALYIIVRGVGKMIGAYVGGVVSNATEPVKRYTGMALWTQGAVAVGLSVMAVHRLSHISAVAGGMGLGELIIFIATASTLLVDVIGPPLVKLGCALAGEIGRSVTEEDVIASWTGAEVMDTDLVTVKEGDTLRRVFELFGARDYLAIPVVGEDGALIGMVSMGVLKHILADHAMWEWLVVSDVMEPVEHAVEPGQRLDEVLQQMDLMELEQVTVVGHEPPRRPVGIITTARVRRMVRQEALRRQQPAERSAPAAPGPTPAPQ